VVAGVAVLLDLELGRGLAWAVGVVSALVPGPAISLTPMTESEARFLTQRIRDDVVRVYRLLFEAHERKAWAALGYRSFREYVAAEFDMSRARAYQLLNQAKVVREISAAVSTDVDIPEAAARELAPVLPDLLSDIRRRLGTAAPGDEQQLVDRLIAEAREVQRVRQEAEAERRQITERSAELMARYRDGTAGPPPTSTRSMRVQTGMSGAHRWTPPSELTASPDAVVGPDSRVTGIADAAILDAHHSAWRALKVLQDLDLERVAKLLTPTEQEQYTDHADALEVWLHRYRAALFAEENDS
jgi:hypothetical protein